MAENFVAITPKGSFYQGIYNSPFYQTPTIAFSFSATPGKGCSDGTVVIGGRGDELTTGKIDLYSPIRLLVLLGSGYWPFPSVTAFYSCRQRNELTVRSVPAAVLESPFIAMDSDSFSNFAASINCQPVSYDGGIQICLVDCDAQVQHLGLEMTDNPDEPISTGIYYLKNPKVKLPHSDQCAYAFARSYDGFWCIGTSFFEGRTLSFTNLDQTIFLPQITIADTKPQ